MAVNVQKIRHEVHKTQDVVSKDLGITIKYISKIENGFVPGRKTMEIMSRYFNKTIDELFYAN